MGYWPPFTILQVLVQVSVFPCSEILRMLIRSDLTFNEFKRVIPCVSLLQRYCI